MPRYHYVLTVQFEAQHGIQQISYVHGIIVPEPGQSRSDVFRHLFRQASERGGRNPVPLFFSLEPDELTSEAVRMAAEDRKD
jgi:hypothetical protein